MMPRRLAGVVLACLCSVAHAQPGVFPKAALTPGKTRPLSTAQVCTIRWGMDRRHVTVAMRRQVFAAYGIAWERRHLFELDHLVPRQLAGADHVDNLFPQPWSVVVEGRQMGARQKDRAENATQRAVCRGELTLRAAQLQVAKDWTVLYRQLVGEFPPEP